MRGLASLAVVLMLGAAALWWGTDGLAAFTAEGARRLEVVRNPRPVQPVALEDHRGGVTDFASFAGKVVLLEFIYTRCPTICSTLGSTFERIRAEIVDSGLAGRVVLVTVSFDPEHDGPEELAQYAERFGGADESWRFLRPRSRPELEALLETAEVTVLPDGQGGFVHNAAIQVVDTRGRLVRILDATAVDEALVVARGLM
ncbi:MAG: SCO family protein [Hyphomicrobiaceae bacterium]|nr:SCO family protein [Hyphomicrobiaceae bacterium]